MGMKRTAKRGDFNRASIELVNRGGYVEGSPVGILRKLGFDGSWNEFAMFFPANVIQTKPGRYAVIDSHTPPQSGQQPAQTSPDIYAICASNFVLGLGEPTDFGLFKGAYGELDLLVGALSRTIDESIASTHFPFTTDDLPLEFYRVERGLLYMADGAGSFQVHGSVMLSQV